MAGYGQKAANCSCGDSRPPSIFIVRDPKRLGGQLNEVYKEAVRFAASVAAGTEIVLPVVLSLKS